VAALSVLRFNHEGLRVDFSTEGGRFRVTADCDRSVAAATIPVSSELPHWLPLNGRSSLGLKLSGDRPIQGRCPRRPPRGEVKCGTVLA
jgi:hypothetical protein